VSKVADLDFEVLSENWTKYRLLPDNAILRVRIAVAKLLQKDSKAGDPSYAVVGQSVASVLVPESLLKKKGDVPVRTSEITPVQIDTGNAMEIRPLESEEYWQEYRTRNGWIVMVRPIVERVLRLPTYSEIDNSGVMEPNYYVQTNMSIKAQAASRIKGIDSSFTIREGKKRFETKNFWAVFRLKRDPRQGDYYIDLLVGRRKHIMDHLKPYAHIGINPDQSTRFVETRGVLDSIRRVIDSKQRGRLADETIEFGKRKEGKPEGTFILKVIIDEPTKTITPRFEEAQLEEK
jgi:hypothetical protein